MKNLKTHLIENGFDAIHENEFENDQVNIEFKNDLYKATYNKGKNTFVDETRKVNVFKQFISIFR